MARVLRSRALSGEDYVHGTHKPAPTVLATGLWNVFTQQVGLVPGVAPDPRPDAPDEGEPPFRPLVMADVLGAPKNGYKVASTFAGGGGSSTGWRLAGFTVVWVNEFNPEARATYEANMAPGTIVEGRSIREVTAEDFFAATGLGPGELDVLDGSPPCQSFSTAGKREKGWGRTLQHVAEPTKQRTDDLFLEYARLVETIRPKVFVAENVSGLVKGTAKGYFKIILQRLRDCGYNVEARLLNAQWLGVPQSRTRLIFVGVRNDLGLDPAFPTPNRWCYSMADACPWLGGCFNRGKHDYRGGEWPVDGPAPTVTATHGNIGTRGADASVGIPTRADGAWFDDGDLQVRQLGNQLVKRWRTLGLGEAHSRSFNLIRSDPSEPSATVLALGAKGAGQVTPPFGARQFTIAEIKRLCSFPDDYALTGKFEQRWARCGNAVPPLMMKAVASAVRDGILARLR